MIKKMYWACRGKNRRGGKGFIPQEKKSDKIMEENDVFRKKNRSQIIITLISNMR